jgi:hypothetical protein
VNIKGRPRGLLEMCGSCERSSKDTCRLALSIVGDYPVRKRGANRSLLDSDHENQFGPERVEDVNDTCNDDKSAYILVPIVLWTFDEPSGVIDDGGVNASCSPRRKCSLYRTRTYIPREAFSP